MIKKLSTLELFIIALSFGSIVGFILPKYITDISQKLNTPASDTLAQDIIHTTEISAQKYSVFIIPEAKIALKKSNPQVVEFLDDEKFWKSFQTEYAENLEELDSEYFGFIADKVHELPRNELQTYLKLKNSEEVRNIQEKITQYMNTQFPLDYKIIFDKLQSQAKDYVEKTNI